MAANHVVQHHPTVPGRGGATLTSVADGRLLAVGGSDREGTLHADALLLPAGPPAARGGAPTALPAAAPLPHGVGGHSATTLAAPDGSGAPVVLLFGGINFAEETVAANMFELWGGRWREVPPEHMQTPSGRTGHTLCRVPPPVVLPAGASGGGGGGAVLPLSAIVGGDASAPLAVLFGGSTPADGPLNDLHIVRCESAGPAPAGAGPWRYAWSAPPTTGPAPAPRELHAAFVRPAIVELLPPPPAEEGEAQAQAPPRVRLLCPAALVVHGGRCEDGAPRRDLCVLDLQARAWAAPLASPHALCSSAAAASPGGLQLLQFGGLAGGAAGLSRRCVLLDTAAGGSAAAAAAGGLQPAAWQWREVALQEPAPQARFAAAAGVVAVRAGAGAGAQHWLCVWGGMTAEEDLSSALWVELPGLQGIAGPAAAAGGSTTE